MTTTTNDLAPYTVRTADGLERPNSPTASADNIESALEAAWRLNRYTECPVVIVDNRDGCPPADRIVCRLTVEWLDGGE